MIKLNSRLNFVYLSISFAEKQKFCFRICMNFLFLFFATIVNCDYIILLIRLHIQRMVCWRIYNRHKISSVSKLNETDRELVRHTTNNNDKVQ